jgi:hypothetical protein
MNLDTLATHILQKHLGDLNDVELVVHISSISVVIFGIWGIGKNIM